MTIKTIALVILVQSITFAEGPWSSVQFTFSHRRTDHQSVEVDWSLNKISQDAREVSDSRLARQQAINIGRIAQYTLHYKDTINIAQNIKEAK